MKKMYVLKNFANKGNRHLKGEIISLEESLAERYSKEGLVKDVLEVLDIKIPTVDLSKYVTVLEHNAILQECKDLRTKVKSLEGKIKELESKLNAKEETPKEKKKSTKK